MHRALVRVNDSIEKYGEFKNKEGINALQYEAFEYAQKLYSTAKGKAVRLQKGGGLESISSVSLAKVIRKTALRQFIFPLTPQAYL